MEKKLFLICFVMLFWLTGCAVNPARGYARPPGRGFVQDGAHNASALISSQAQRPPYTAEAQHYA